MDPQCVPGADRSLEDGAARAVPPLAGRGCGRFEDAPDLAKAIRPRLDRLTTQLLRAMADNQALLHDSDRKADVAVAMHALQARALAPDAAEQALAPFLSPD